MAKYAIYLDYIYQKARCCFPWLAKKIQKHIDIPENKTFVSYSNLPYCPWDKKKKGSHRIHSTTTDSEECEHGQLIAPHFEWVLEALTAGPDLKTQLKAWLEENRSREELKANLFIFY